ncbi:MAG TPA: hypothetical protein VLQ29_06160 [Candidatus Dormibacteraeota bacterium]|nr:hypothetical protein [Candidatus Dormibacteraeota bacterium]
MDNQSVSVGIAKCRPTANLRFTWTKEEGHIMIAQMPDSGVKILNFKSR